MSVWLVAAIRGWAPNLDETVAGLRQIKTCSKRWHCQARRTDSTVVAHCTRPHSHVTQVLWSPYVIVCTHVCMYVCMYVCIHTYIHTCKYIYIHIHTRRCNDLHIHVCVHIYIYVEREREREREREGGREHHIPSTKKRLSTIGPCRST